MNKRKGRRKTANLQNSNTLIDIATKRDGGQNALRGYTYQLLYSCFVLLSASEDEYFRLEGIEDVDVVDSSTTHVQIKYSTNTQNASFLDSVLKNFVEVYLVDKTRRFKLVYDFPIAEGNLKQLVQNNLTNNSTAFWKKKIEQIAIETPSWDWNGYEYDEFISHISFECLSKDYLETQLEYYLVNSFGLTTGNLELFSNALKYLCLESMCNRSEISKRDIFLCIEKVKDDISKGFINPANNWVSRIVFEYNTNSTDTSYFEGKKATPADIAKELPVPRLLLEKTIEESILNNFITVIKASSGQGKTTLAYRVIKKLSSQYSPYQLLTCNDPKDVGNIFLYVKSRLQIGERVLLFLDNLDRDLKNWNNLIRLFQTKPFFDVRVLVTTRESDWYHYAGDLSDIHSINIIKPLLEENEAFDIFNKLKKEKLLSSDVNDWRSAWRKIGSKKLLIEYIFLLTHGEMLAERIDSQIAEIGKTDTGKAKIEILRNVSFADVCGLKTSIEKLYSNHSECCAMDFGELIKSLENEFLVHVNSEKGVIEGLHPVRSMHLVKRLHSFFPLSYTALSVVEMTNTESLSILASSFPSYEELDQMDFCTSLFDLLYNQNNLIPVAKVLEGLLSGSISNYYIHNRELFDEANKQNSLFVISSEICPFVIFEEFDYKLSFLDGLYDSASDKKRIEELLDLKKRFPVFDLKKSFVYLFCQVLFQRMNLLGFDSVGDINSYSDILEFIFLIDKSFNLAPKIPLPQIWKNTQEYTIETIARLMYLSFCGNKEYYMSFVHDKFELLLTQIKQLTESHRLFTIPEKNEIHVEYILQTNKIAKQNDESVYRLRTICRMLPFFDLYCADAIKPTINCLSQLGLHDDAHKTIPKKNLIISFHQRMASIWNKTIESNYEFDSFEEWSSHWIQIRSTVVELLGCIYSFILLLLKGENRSAKSEHYFKELVEKYTKLTSGEHLFPRERRPFLEEPIIAIKFKSIKSNYFDRIYWFLNLVPQMLKREQQATRVCINNIEEALSSLSTMQGFFIDLGLNRAIMNQNKMICEEEVRIIPQVLNSCLYYSSHKQSRSFDKYMINKWAMEQEINNRTQTQNSLSELKQIVSVVFPEAVLKNGIIQYYPIIIRDWDKLNEEIITRIIIECIPFKDSKFDYLVILTENDNSTIEQNAIRIHKTSFEKLNSIKDSDEVDSFDFFRFLPIEVTQELLSCFSQKYYIVIQEVNSNSESVILFADCLWAYSKTRSILQNPCDIEYRDKKLIELEGEINNELKTIKESESSSLYDSLNNEATAVLNGKDFDDSDLNALIEKSFHK